MAGGVEGWRVRRRGASDGLGAGAAVFDAVFDAAFAGFGAAAFASVFGAGAAGLGFGAAFGAGVFAAGTALASTGFGAATLTLFLLTCTGFFSGFFATLGGAAGATGAGAGVGSTLVLTIFGFAAVFAAILGSAFAAGFFAAGFGFATAFGFGLLRRWLVKSGALAGAGFFETGTALNGAQRAWFSTWLTRSCCSTVFPINCHPATVAPTGSTNKFMWIVLLV